MANTTHAPHLQPQQNILYLEQPVALQEKLVPHEALSSLEVQMPNEYHALANKQDISKELLTKIPVLRGHPDEFKDKVRLCFNQQLVLRYLDGL